MEMRRISDQGNETLVEYFAQFRQSPHAPYRAVAEQMIKLIHHIEQDVDAPMQWVTTSHFWIYFGNVDHWDPQKARVFVYPRSEGFEIRYRSTQRFFDWTNSFTVILANSIAEAIAAIVFAVQQAVPDPVGRFFPE